MLTPGDHLWIDAWVPRADPLWNMDVAVAAEWVGRWWSATLDTLGVPDLVTHLGKSDPGSFGALVCFAGRGPGEVFSGARKVVGVSQWRGREGALFSSCAYRHWDPDPLLALLEVDPAERTRLRRSLPSFGIGVVDLVPSFGDLAVLGEAMLASFASLT